MRVFFFHLIIHTYSAFRLDTFHLPLIHFADLSTAPELSAHICVTNHHCCHGNDVGQKEQDQIVSETK